MVLDGGQSMTKPLIVVNFKTYASASGATAVGAGVGVGDMAIGAGAGAGASRVGGV